MCKYAEKLVIIVKENERTKETHSSLFETSDLEFKVRWLG
jgi:hypothetical protein